MDIFKQVKNILKKIYGILTPQQKRGGAVVFVLLFLGSLLEMLGVSVIVPLVQIILMPESVLADESYQWLWNLLHVNNTKSLILWVSGGAIAVFLIKNGYMTFLSYYKNFFFRNVE